MLKTLFPGGEGVMHSRLPLEILRSDRLFVGSIRNPWDWYVSLWGYGCDGKGDLRNRLVGRRSLLGHGFRRSISGGLRNMYSDLRRRPDFWAELYSDVNSPELFRIWLRSLLDSRRKGEQRGGYCLSTLRGFAGYYTYRYCRLFHGSNRALYDGSVTDMESLITADAEQNMVEYTIHTETLVADFREMLHRSGEEVPLDRLKEAEGLGRTNPSSRKREYAAYYDQETADLVAGMDALIVNRYGYQFTQSG